MISRATAKEARDKFAAALIDLATHVQNGDELDFSALEYVKEILNIPEKWKY